MPQARLHAEDESRAEPVLAVDELSKSYDGTVKAVDKLSFGIAEGEMFGLLGPNGAGKSTTIGMLTTRIVPTSGRILVNGMELAGRECAYRANIGVVSQSPTLDHSVSLWQGLYFHARYHGMRKHKAREAAQEALELVKLTDYGQRSPSTLSGGQAQRAMIARAVIHRPQFLLFDEPTAGLDPQSRRDLWHLMRTLNANGSAILITTHYMEEAFEVCDRVGILSQGRLAAIDRPTRLIENFGGLPSITVRLSEISPRMITALRTRFASVEFVGRSEFRTRAEDPQQAIDTVMTMSRDHGAALLEAVVREPSLESAYLNLTSEKL